MRRSLVFSTIWFGLGAALTAADAKAQDKSQYTLFNPTPVDKMRDFNTDRPTKSNVPYTVDAGHFQYEGDLFVYGYDNVSTSDTNITSWTVGNPTFKLGLLNNLDVEVNFSFYNSIRSATVSTGAYTISQGFGDTFTRFKWNLFGNDGGGPAFALIPYAKWPTAPMAPQGVGNGYIVNIPVLLNISRPIIEKVTAYAEIFTNWSTNPQAPNIVTADFAVAWQPRPNFQLDVGVNIGLNYAAIPYQIYVGIAQRF